MFRIVKKKELNTTVTLMEIEAPNVARKAEPGQFIILRVDSEGERIPLTIAGCDKERGTVKIIFQIVGATTEKLNRKNQGEYIEDFVGPLGKPTETEGIKKVAIVGGGVGCAIALPVAEKFHKQGAEVTSIIGFRSKDLVILEDEFKAVADNLILMTDDGSYGQHGLVTQPLKEMLEAGEQFDEVLAIGPIPMMKFVSLTTLPFGTHTSVSLNPIMVDGTGMCGGCRVTVGGETSSVVRIGYADEEAKDAYIILEDKNTPDTIKNGLNGKITSTFPLNYAYATIKDADGKLVRSSLKNNFTNIYELDLCDMNNDLDLASLGKGTYTYNYRIAIARGGVDLEHFEFTV